MVSRMIIIELIDAVIEQIKRDLNDNEDATAIVELLLSVPRDALEAYLPDSYEPSICPTCNGSGEGMHEGTTCRVCKGKGES